MTATNTCGSFSYNYTFSATGVPCVQMESMVATPQVNIYPNPNNGLFTVEYSSTNQDSGIQEIVVINSLGSNIFREKYKSQKSVTIALPGRKSDKYFVEVFDGKDWTCYNTPVNLGQGFS